MTSPAAGSRRLLGTGLHSGRPCSLELVRSPGPVGLSWEGKLRPRGELELLRTDAGVCVRYGSEAVDLVEHLFAALGGLSVQHGVALSVLGGEVPLLDGGALAFARALAALDPPAAPPALCVTRRARIAIGPSVYDFEPASRVEVRAEVEFEPLPAQTASWDGTPEDFVTNIAPARTFGFLRDAEQLRARHRAQGVDLAHVLVLDAAGAPLPQCAPMQQDELARHKLLDLIGDSFLYGGPPLGRTAALRPGHSATHQAFRTALATGVLEWQAPTHGARRRSGAPIGSSGGGPDDVPPVSKRAEAR